MKLLFKMMDGYKTYMVAIAIVIAGFNMIGAGDWQGGLLHIVQAPEMLIVFAGLGLGTLRESVAKLLLALQNPVQLDDTPSMDDYMYIDVEGRPISKAEYNAIIELGVMKPVIGLKS